MRIYVDADAFPNTLREILIRAGARTKVPVIFVANKPLKLERSANCSFLLVPAGPDVADDRVAALVEPGDLVITADIPLADRVIAKGAYAIDPRGDLYTEENIKDRLALRGLLTELRDTGEIMGGPAGFGQRDRQAFANQLDRILIRQLKKESS
jgi:uncharacterized protein YaiI (UPF0178 family)